MSKRNLTIYLPTASGLFRRSVRAAGGAERQMTVLGEEMARKGYSVGFVVYPVDDPVSGIEPNLTLIERGPHTGSDGIVGLLIEAFRVLRALVAANGRVVVVRGGTPVLGFVGFFCRVWRRRLVFSSANDFDFLPRPGVSKLQARLYSFGVRAADAVVVQSSDQVDLARRAFPQIRRLVHIPSFADDPAEGTPRPEPTTFIWAGRLVGYKRPLMFAELAAAVPEASFLLVPHVSANPLQWQVDALAELAPAVARLPNLELGTRLPHAELVERLASAVAVVNTSEFEGMPNTFLEAWSQGVPVLTFSIDPGSVVAENGLGIAAGGSWDAFVAGARTLWVERFDRDEYARRTRSYLRDVHSRQAVGARWDELLRSLGAVVED